MLELRNHGDLSAPGEVKSNSSIWYCPSRWLLAYRDANADINTLSSHMCLADLNDDGENLLSLVDIKHRPQEAKGESNIKCLYDCRMRVYRGQQLIYNHFLEEMPACLIASSVHLPVISDAASGRQRHDKATDVARTPTSLHQPLLTLAINDDIYFYHKLKPSHRISLTDEDCILETLHKSEIDAWRMVRENQVDAGTLHELLSSISQEFGNHTMTSHSINYLALESDEARKQYLATWKLKRIQNGSSGNLMCMDTICCASARLKYISTITRSGDFGQTREDGSIFTSQRSSRMIDMQRDGLVLGTEDRHLLVYELRSLRTRLECHYRLSSVPDNILVERRAPSSWNIKSDIKSLTYKILVSCRNCHIYLINQPYNVSTKTSPGKVRDFLALKANVLDMSWVCADNDSSIKHTNSDLTESRQNFLVACSDKKVYCFETESGICKWAIELDLPVTSVVCLPKMQNISTESSLIGVATRSNRIDFHLSSTGRVVDSIYIGGDDYVQAMTFGRFGREDNCLCVTTSLGHLLIFILKRTAKFAHGQCLSSAASYASEAIANYCHRLQEFGQTQDPIDNQQHLSLDMPARLPSAFALTKSSLSGKTDQMLNSILTTEHDCDQAIAKNKLDNILAASQLQVPLKSRDFVNQILEQAQISHPMSNVFIRDMLKLGELVKSTQDKQPALKDVEQTSSRISLSQVVGLGNIYRATLMLRLNLQIFSKYDIDNAYDQPDRSSPQETLNSTQLTSARPLFGRICVLLSPAANNITPVTRCEVKPFRSKLNLGTMIEELKEKSWILEKTIECKLTLKDRSPDRDAIEEENLAIECVVYFEGTDWTPERQLKRPIYYGVVRIPVA